MIAHGHLHVDLYSIGQIWDETQLVRSRVNRQLATETTLLFSAISTAVASFGKKSDATQAHKNFQKLIKDLEDG